MIIVTPPRTESQLTGGKNHFWEKLIQNLKSTIEAIKKKTGD